MTDENNNLELLLQKLVDGEISESEKAELEASLANDANLRDTLDELTAANSAMNLLVSNWALPTDFTQRVLGGLPSDDSQTEAKIIPMPSRFPAMLAAAAAIVLMLGLVFVGNALMPDGSVDDTYVANANTSAIDDEPVNPIADKTFVVELVGGADATLEHNGQREALKTRQDVALPVIIESSKSAHTTVRAGNATIVLQPGARARLLDIDADGVADIEPLEGDVYIESQRGVRAKLSGIRLQTSGGVMLRQQDSAYLAEPSHGKTLIGDDSLAFKQCAYVSDDGVSISNCPDSLLDGWAIEGRLDAIKAALRDGGHEPDSNPHFEKLEQFMRGMLSEPSKAAANAYSFRFMLKHNFFQELGLPDDQIVMLSNIADIIGEGTNEADILPNHRAIFNMLEKQIKQDPSAVKRLAKMFKEQMEKAAKRHGRSFPTND